MTAIGLAPQSTGVKSVSADLRPWLAIFAFAAALLLLHSRLPAALGPVTEPWIPVADWMGALLEALTRHVRWLSRGIADLLQYPLRATRTVLQWLPWPAAVLGAVALGYAAGGARLACFAAAGMLYVLVTGYWDETTYTLALAIVAVPIATAAGLFIGILGHRSKRARRVIDPALDFMQTIPVFAYLIPILVLFGVGPVLGLVAAAIFAIPPMVRNVMLGLERVPTEIVESATMAGSTRRQLLWWAQLPAALPTLLMGVNQTIMATLSMVVIAAMLGGFHDIGLEVFSAMRRADFGRSILSGVVIAILAMILDRISRGFADRQMDPKLRLRGKGRRRAVLAVIAAAMVGFILLGPFVPALARYPQELVFFPAEALNEAIEEFSATFFWVTSALKDAGLLYILLPLKLGLAGTIRLQTWGFELTPAIAWTYGVVLAAGLWLVVWRRGLRLALALTAVVAVYSFGTLGLPWPAVILAVTLLAYQTSGWKLAVPSAVALLFILAAGLWDETMVSLQLCGAGVVLSFLLGGALGIWAALDDRVSKVLQPINDTLQTIPIFVFLIPGIMVFLVGEFTALIAVVMYAIVPAIRYTELGIRTVPVAAVEAAKAHGATTWQLLWQVQLPIALPEIMLALNQTIMMALSMVVVAALVGARGLGQAVMTGLTAGAPGLGVAAGLAIAFIAIITDRMIQSWSGRRKAELGLT